MMERLAFYLGRKWFGLEFQNWFEDFQAAEILANDPTVSMIEFTWPEKLSRGPVIALGKFSSEEDFNVEADDEPWN